jgi:hypothetical protein
VSELIISPSSEIEKESSTDYLRCLVGIRIRFCAREEGEKRFALYFDATKIDVSSAESRFQYEKLAMASY